MNSNSQPPSLQSEDLKIPQQQRIKLLTYNTFLRPPLVKNNQDDYKNERCQFIINSLLKYYSLLILL
ncbi:Sphingomyelin phosphodiesterase 2 [Paramecium bursaria]